MKINRPKEPEVQVNQELIDEIGVFLYWRHLFLMAGVQANQKESLIKSSKEDVSKSVALERSKAYHPGIKGVLDYLKQEGLLK